MNFDYVPKDCKSVGKDKALFKGKLVLKMPSFQQRHLYMTKCNFGVVKETTSIAANKNNIESIIELVDLSKDHYVKVDLEKLSDNKKFTKFDDLIYDPDCDGILREVAMEMLHGFRPGKN